MSIVMGAGTITSLTHVRNGSNSKLIMCALVLVICVTGCKSKKKAMEAEKVRIEQEVAQKRKREEAARRKLEAEEKARLEAEARQHDNTPNVKWMSFEEAVEKSKKEKKKIFIDVYTDWCGWCKVMDKNTFNDPEVARILNEKFYPVKFNAEQREDILFAGHTFKFVQNGRSGYHELAVSLLNNQLSYPTVVFLTEDFKMIQPLPGYRKADEFHKIIKYIGEDHYRSKSYEDFQKTYESPYAKK